MADESLSGWRLRRLAVCGSSEDELDRWLQALGSGAQATLQRQSLAVVAGRQLRGRGQRGRSWQSPPGGLWLSAAMAWPVDAISAGATAAPLTLAAAVGLALQLDAFGLACQIKWPNDLLLGGRKLAGLLARLRLQGSRVRWGQVGVGLNGTNPVPAGAIGLGELLPPGQAGPEALLPLALAALDWSCAHARQPQVVLALANQRLYRPQRGLLHQGRQWQIRGLGPQGELLLERDGQRLELRQSEPRQGVAAAGAVLSPENPV